MKEDSHGWMARWGLSVSGFRAFLLGAIFLRSKAKKRRTKPTMIASGTNGSKKLHRLLQR
jgi:hypothetical protein